MPRWRLQIVVLAFVLASAIGCEPGPQPCNADDECLRGLNCILGTCVDRERDDVAETGTGEIIAEDPRCTPGVNGSLVYVDNDRDGHGFGAPECRAFPVPDGFAPTGDDCDDNDASVFALQSVYLDRDGDGFTAGSELRCVGSAPQDGVALTPRRAPVHLLEPLDIYAISGDWDEQDFAFYRFQGDIGTLALSGFQCASRLEEVVGVEVRVFLDGGDESIAVSAELIANGFGGESRREVANAFGVEVVLGGADDTFGMVLTPEMACDPSLTLLLTIEVEAGGDFFAPVIARPSMVVYGVDDCNDTALDEFSPAELRIDADHDGFAAGPLRAQCVSLTLPTGTGVRERDCAPEDDDAFPGQTARFSQPRNGVGGFDYNCNGQEEKQHGEIQDVTSCSYNSNNGNCQWNYYSRSLSCGQSLTHGHCNLNGCVLQNRTTTQACK